MTAAASIRETRLATWLCFVLPLTLYALTAARTIQGGDSGEYGLIGMIGGVAHPPGYPLYSLLIRIGAHLFPGPPFLRVALVSALCGAAAVAVVQRAALLFSGDLFASVAAALVFAVSRTQWRLAGIPEVFAMNALLAATVLLLAMRVRRGTGEALALGLAFGLGISNHLSIIWCTPLVVWALLGTPALIQRTLVGAALGLVPYLSLPIMARLAGPGAPVWGHVDTVGGFVDHVLRSEYGTFRLTSAGSAQTFNLAPIKAYFEELPAQFAWLLFALGLRV